jgi:antitoxin (DNA-binding transcriptional repressor) of toxin-antitoxin stability system
MRSVGLKVLKNRLSEYIRAVANGETVLVTDRDRVVAEIRPPAGRGPSSADAFLAEAMRRGWLSAPIMPGSALPARSPVAPLRDLLAELDVDRGER